MKKVKMLAVMAALFAATARMACAQEAEHSGHEHQQMTHDQLRIAVQKICPVSGGKLGSMGDPVKAKIGQEDVFLCCEACMNRKVSKDRWAAIHANIAKAQAKCPVMNKPLPENPKGTIVEGQIVYICCPSCDKKIEADPKTYLQKVDSLYTASLKARQASR